MKTLIVGTGSIGVIYGWALFQAGVAISDILTCSRQEIFDQSR